MLRNAIGLGEEIDFSFLVFFPHLIDIDAEPIFPCDFVTLRKMVDLLILVEPIIQIGFAGAAAPNNVPLMRVGVREMIGLEDGPHQFSVSPEDLVEQLIRLNLGVLLAIANAGRHTAQNLIGPTRSNIHKFVLIVNHGLHILLLPIPRIEVIEMLKVGTLERGDSGRCGAQLALHFVKPCVRLFDLFELLKLLNLAGHFKNCHHVVLVLLLLLRHLLTLVLAVD